MCVSSGLGYVCDRTVITFMYIYASVFLLFLGKFGPDIYLTTVCMHKSVLLNMQRV